MLRVRTIWDPGGVVGGGVTVMHFLADTEDAAAAATANTDVGTFWTSLQSTMNSSVTSWHTDSTVDHLNSAGVLLDRFTVTPVTGGGTSSSELLPHQVQALVRWKTGTFTGGRELIGRTFVPNQVETSNASGVIIAGTLTVIQNAANALNSATNPSLAVWSKRSSLVASVASAVVPSKWATLNKRRD